MVFFYWKRLINGFRWEIDLLHSQQVKKEKEDNNNESQCARPEQGQ